MPWKVEREPIIKLCMGRQIDVVQRFITIQNAGHNRQRTDGTRVEYFPRIHHIAALPQSPRVTVNIECITRKISLDGSSSCRSSTTSHGDLKTTKIMRIKYSAFARRFSARCWFFFGPGSEKKWYSTREIKPQRKMGQSRRTGEDKIK